MELPDTSFYCCSVPFIMTIQVLEGIPWHSCLLLQCPMCHDHPSDARHSPDTPVYCCSVSVITIQVVECIPWHSCLMHFVLKSSKRWRFHTWQYCLFLLCYDHPCGLVSLHGIPVYWNFVICVVIIQVWKVLTLHCLLLQSDMRSFADAADTPA